MSTPQPFEPDDIYCVYCHAPAAGMCAECGAICCADCVELKMAMINQKAVCHSCAPEEDVEALRPVPSLRLFVAATGLALAVGAILWIRS